MKQRHPADPPQWKSKHQWKSKKNHNGTTTLTPKMLIGIRGWGSQKEGRGDRQAHHHGREDRQSEGRGKDWKNNPFFKLPSIEEEKKEEVKEALPPASKRISPLLPPPPPRGPRSQSSTAKEPPAATKALPGEPPAAAKVVAKEAPQPKARPPALTSDEVKRERAKARNAAARVLMEQM